MTNSPRSHIGNHWLSALLISVVAIPLLFLIWGRTGEILQDFGNDLYFSSQICHGKVLYCDIACLYGPLSPYFNAAIMRLFGTTLHVLLLTNFAILTVTILLLYRLLDKLAGAFTASVAVAFFLTVFALSSPTRITNYNFLTPYAHQITHGFLICLALLWALDRYHQKQSLLSAAAVGLLTGLAFLTKPEVFLAAAATFSLGLAASLWIHHFKRAAPTLLIAASAILAPTVIALVYFCTQMPLHSAFNGIFGGWQYLRQPYVLSAPFYAESLGIDHPLQNSLLMFQYAALYALLIAAIASIAFLIPKNPNARIATGFFLAGALFILTLIAGDHFPTFWMNSPRGLPVFVAVALVLAVRSLRKTRTYRALLQFCFTTLAAVFLAKIVLCTRFYQYGFILAAPTAIITVLALFDWLPNWIARHNGSAALFRIAAIGILAPFAVEYISVTAQVLSERTLRIPLPENEHAWTTPRNADLVAAIQYLSRYPTATLAVIPDAVGINYATSLPNPVPYIVLNPMTLKWFGEPNVINAFQKNPPTFILITTANDDAFGAHRFGQDFGLPLAAWITTNYKPLATFSTTDRPAELLIHR